MSHSHKEYISIFLKNQVRHITKETNTFWLATAVKALCYKKSRQFWQQHLGINYISIYIHKLRIFNIITANMKNQTIKYNVKYCISIQTAKIQN